MPNHGYSRTSPGKGSPPDWKQGDIAFLKPATSFSPRDYDDLIGSGYIPIKATTHPVIILAARNQRAIITTVSAYSTEENGFRPPWQQRCHRRKNPDHFRAFEGTQRPNRTQTALRLADSSMTMPKPQASWVFIESFWCVPFSALGYFNKSPRRLRVHPESVQQLTQDMRKFEKRYQDTCARYNGPTATRTPAPTAAAVPVPVPLLSRAALAPPRALARNWGTSVANRPTSCLDYRRIC